ncbi:endonuclease [Klebsiella pneumoniae subsp. ozaenae]|uniref:phospholipase D n=1 Tax=Klebsiella pneumoniae subsp. ozaenae TaxID=574 RepID=A0A378UFU0_KLEPO|nr:endonuclease [Klebsiella pneumoniae subsp. ozaenae]
MKSQLITRRMLVGLISLTLFTTQVLAAETEIGFSPEGSALQLVLNTINSSTESIRLMGYSFTSPEVAGALVRAKQRDVDVKVVLDGKENTGKQHQASQAAMNLLANAGMG